MSWLSFAGLVALLAGVALVITGIGGAIDEVGSLREDAVATGVVGERIAIEGADAKQTVYLDLDEFGSNSAFHDTLVAGTSCRVTADGFRDSFTGAVQGVSTTIGRYASVGSFTLPDGFGRLECITTAGPPDRNLPLVVTPHGGGAVFAAVLQIIGGVILFGLGVAGAVIGILRRRRADRAVPPPGGPPR